ncbi:SMP-30/gluconolactonase/LRE family protein [candidate division KSB1 bacterium]|nr:SMP-30/gluconolactonase/LRE family protein [candidate division KSB1 bacterium]RQW00627.1 MAG: SMP-30/gluconolactonase/LRE family protein [candidate division KSB1 bacterium]
MKSILIYLIVFCTAIVAQDMKTIGLIHREDSAVNILIPEDAVIEVLAEGFDWSEGPVWIQDGGYLLFNDIPPNTLYKWNESDGLSVFLRPAGYAIGDNPPGREVGCNGLFVNPTNGQLVLCDHGNRCLAQLNQQNWIKTVLIDKFDGRRLNSPNDVVIRSDGHIYFTDPPYGLLGQENNPAKELDFNGVFHLSPDSAIELITKELPRPNGIILSPDEKKLYVANSASNAIWMVFDVEENGSASNGRIFFDANSLRAAGKRGGCDGMTIDTKGNLYATGPGGVLILSPDAKLLGTIETGAATSNCCFGGDNGDELYITSDMYLCRVKTLAQGIGF